MKIRDGQPGRQCRPASELNHGLNPSAMRLRRGADQALLGVQWHAEYDPQRNPINRALFQAFGEALVERQRHA